TLSHLVGEGGSEGVPGSWSSRFDASGGRTAPRNLVVGFDANGGRTAPRNLVVGFDASGDARTAEALTLTLSSKKGQRGSEDTLGISVVGVRYAGTVRGSRSPHPHPLPPG